MDGERGQNQHRGDPPGQAVGGRHDCSSGAAHVERTDDQRAQQYRSARHNENQPDETVQMLWQQIRTVALLQNQAAQSVGGGLQQLR